MSLNRSLAKRLNLLRHHGKACSLGFFSAILLVDALSVCRSSWIFHCDSGIILIVLIGLF
jgi:hypothetical protein